MRELDNLYQSQRNADASVFLKTYKGPSLQGTQTSFQVKAPQSMTEGSPKTRDGSQFEAYSNLKSSESHSFVSSKRTRPKTSLGTNRRVVLMNPMQIAQVYAASRNQTDRKTLDSSTLPLKRCDTKTSERHPENEEWGT